MDLDTSICQQNVPEIIYTLLTEKPMREEQRVRICKVFHQLKGRSYEALYTPRNVAVDFLQSGRGAAKQSCRLLSQIYGQILPEILGKYLSMLLLSTECDLARLRRDRQGSEELVSYRNPSSST